MQGIYTYIPETNYVPSKYSVAAILFLLFMVLFFLVYLHHVPLQIAILHAWKDHRTRFTLYTFPSYFRLIPMAVCVLFVFLDL